MVYSRVTTSEMALLCFFGGAIVESGVYLKIDASGQGGSNRYDKREGKVKKEEKNQKGVMCV